MNVQNPVVWSHCLRVDLLPKLARIVQFCAVLLFLLSATSCGLPSPTSPDAAPSTKKAVAAPETVDDASEFSRSSDGNSNLANSSESVRWQRDKSTLGGTSAVTRFAEKQEAKQDTWDTEVLSDAAGEQLTRLRTLLERPAGLSTEDVLPLVSEDFSCRELLPPATPEEAATPEIQTSWWNDSDAIPSPIAAEADRGAAGLIRQLDRLRNDLPPEHRHTSFKIIHIATSSASFSTLVRYEGSGFDGSYSRQHVARWHCEWTLPRQDSRDLPRLTKIQLRDWEASRVALAGGRLFQDVTRSVLGANASYESQVLPGINQWLHRLPREFMGQFGHHGIALGDVNQDGLDDLYVCDAGGLPNRLYIQQPDGTAIETAGLSGVDFLDDSTSALWIDFDNDGDQDLVVATDPLLQFAENDGTGRFTLRLPIEVSTDTFSIVAADYDQDGYVDLYVCGYNVRKQDPTRRDLPFPLPYHDANNGGRNLLLRNTGNWRFEDVTRTVGLDENNSRFSMAAAWEDYDNDGDQDLYVANDFGRNNLYRNDGGHFTDVANMAGVEDQASGMSVTWGDANRDGRMDVYISNMFSSAGNRITYQPQFGAGVAASTVSQLQRMARGNTLYLNSSELSTGSAHFDDVSEAMQVTMGRWAWASKFVDLTNDGWQDLVVANGYLTNELPDDL